MDLGIAQRVALIVGGSGRIGQAVARQLAEEGAVIALAARDRSKLEAVSAQLAGASIYIVDTSDDTSVDALVSQVIRDHGRIDILVNTAAPPANTLDSSRDRDPMQIIQAIEGKSMGYLRVTNAVLPHLLDAGWGRVVQVSGQNAVLTGSMTASARNSVVSIAAKVIADSAAGTGVTVNVVNPGPVVDSEPSTEVAIGSPGQSTYADVAAAIVYLCSEQARAISGETVALGHRVRGAMVL